MNQVSLTQSDKMQGIRALTNKQKANLLPSKGVVFGVGPFVFRVSHVNVGKLRFSSELIDVEEDKRDKVIKQPTLDETIIVGAKR